MHREGEKNHNKVYWDTIDGFQCQRPEQQVDLFGIYLVEIKMTFGCPCVHVPTVHKNYSFLLYGKENDLEAGCPVLQTII